MDLGQLAGDHHWPVAAERVNDILDCFPNPVRSFVENDRMLGVAHVLHRGSALS